MAQEIHRLERIVHDYFGKPNSQSAKANPKGGRKPSPKGGSLDGSKRPRDTSFKCLGCQSPEHRLESCVKVTDTQERKKLMSEYYENKRRKLKCISLKLDVEAQKAQLYSAIFEIKNTSSQVVPIRYNQSLSWDSLLDSGSDYTIIPQSLISELAKHGAVDVIPLSTQMKIELADGKTEILSSSMCVLDLELTTRNGTVNLRRIPCYVVPGNGLKMPYVGESELRSLGIDPKTNLERLLTHIQSTTDEMESEEDSKEIQKLEDAMEAMINRANVNGLPNELQHELRTLVYEYKDILRISLQNDLPADVQPM